MRSLLFASLTVSLALLAAPVSAHIQLISPVQRHSDQKVGPCGVGANDMRGPEVATYKPGEKIVVSWTETVNHPGHFRISFDADGFDDFVDPASYDDLYTNNTVLLDDIADVQGGMVMAEVTLPDIECDNCTLQVIQVMTDKPPYEPGTNDLYYQCADIRLMGETMGTTGEPGTGGETSTSEPHPGTTSGPGETGEDPPGETGGDDPTTDVDPTTAGEAHSTGAGETTAAATTTGATTDATATAPSTESAGGEPQDDDKGCSCRTTPSSAGLLALVIPLLTRRRRR